MIDEDYILAKMYENATITLKELAKELEHRDPIVCYALKIF